MKKILSIVAALAFLQATTAQALYTKNGLVSFYSHTSVEDIKAENAEVVSFLDIDKGEFRFQLLVKGFQFKKAAMQEHFNTPDYMDSDKFPKSEFKGKIDNLKAVDFKKDGTYNVTVSGSLTMHGVTKTIAEKGTITVVVGKVSLNAVFKIKRADYGVSAPSFAAAKIAEEIEVTVKCNYEPYKKG